MSCFISHCSALAAPPPLSQRHSSGALLGASKVGGRRALISIAKTFTAPAFYFAFTSLHRLPCHTEASDEQVCIALLPCHIILKGSDGERERETVPVLFSVVCRMRFSLSAGRAACLPADAALNLRSNREDIEMSNVHFSLEAKGRMSKRGEGEQACKDPKCQVRSSQMMPYSHRSNI